MTEERIRIEYWPISPMATVMTGRKRCRAKSPSCCQMDSYCFPSSNMPLVGNQPRPVAKMPSMNMPMTKYGIE